MLEDVDKRFTFGPSLIFAPKGLAWPGGTEAKFIRASELILQALPLPHTFDIPTTQAAK